MSSYRPSVYRLRKALADKKGNPYWEVLDAKDKVVFVHGTKGWAVDWIIEQNLWKQFVSFGEAKLCNL